MIKIVMSTIAYRAILEITIFIIIKGLSSAPHPLLSLPTTFSLPPRFQPPPPQPSLSHPSSVLCSFIPPCAAFDLYSKTGLNSAENGSMTLFGFTQTTPAIQTLFPPPPGAGYKLSTQPYTSHTCTRTCALRHAQT